MTNKEFELREENFHDLIARFRSDFGKDDIELLYYFMNEAKEKMILMEKVNKLNDFLVTVFYEDGNAEDAIEKAMEHLRSKTNQTSQTLEYYRKVNKVNGKLIEDKKEVKEQLIDLKEYSEKYPEDNIEIYVKEINRELDKILKEFE